LSVVISFSHRVIAEITLFAIYFVIEGRWYGGLNDHTYSAIAVNTFSSFLIYWALVGTFVAVDYYRQFQTQQLEMVRIENELNNAQLQALRMQLQPHFLFNTLHTISSLMDENVEQAQKMISQIGYLLRGLLDQDHRATISLKDEMRYIRSYLDIEQTRFRDRLSVRYEITEETLAAQVPNLILQPLVENAVKHGFSRRSDSGTIRVSSKRDNGKLHLIVEDDGRGVGDADAIVAKSGIGLENVRKRLHQMYEGEAELRLDSPNRGGFLATISMPFEVKIESGATGS
jgi:LytS/YehU family sensor histidine kinase